MASILQVAVGHGASPRAESTVLPPPLLDVALAEPPRVEGETKTAVAPRVKALVPSDEKPGAQDGRCSLPAGGGRKEPERTRLGGGAAEYDQDVCHGTAAGCRRRTSVIRCPRPLVEAVSLCGL